MPILCLIGSTCMKTGKRSAMKYDDAAQTERLLVLTLLYCH